MIFHENCIQNFKMLYNLPEYHYMEIPLRSVLMSVLGGMWYVESGSIFVYDEELLSWNSDIRM